MRALAKVATAAFLVAGCSTDLEPEPVARAAQAIDEQALSPDDQFQAAEVWREPSLDQPTLFTMTKNAESYWVARHEPLAGLADLHIHQFAEYAFNANWFHGSAVGNEATALATCDRGATIVPPPDNPQTTAIQIKIQLIPWPQILVHLNVGLPDHVRRDLLRLGLKRVLEWKDLHCLGFWIAGKKYEALDCIGFDNIDNVVLHLWGGTHASAKLPFDQKKFSDDGNHVNVKGGFQYGYQGWPVWSTGAHQQVWEGWVREAHEKQPFLYYLQQHAFVPGTSTFSSSYLNLLRSKYGFIASWFPLAAAVAEFRSNYQVNMAEARRAGQVGLNLMVTSAVDSRILCALTPGPQNGSTFLFDHWASTPSHLENQLRNWGLVWDRCGKQTIDLQLSRARSWAAANSSWVGLATSQAQARSLIEAGKLALILSVEDTDMMTGVDDSQLAAQVATMKSQGVTTFQMVHHLDNTLGGAGFVQQAFEIWQALRTAYGGSSTSLALDGAIYSQKGPAGIIRTVVQPIMGWSNSDLGDQIKDLTKLDYNEHGYDDWQQNCWDVWHPCWKGWNHTVRVCGPPIWTAGRLIELTGGMTKDKMNQWFDSTVVPRLAPSFPSCADPTNGLYGGASGVDCMRTTNFAGQYRQHENMMGLTARGRIVADAMVANAMPIDIAHMSTKAIKDLDAYLTSKKYCAYPMYVSHGHVRAALEHVDGDGNVVPEQHDSKGVVTNWVESERTLTPDILGIIKNRGGMVGLRTGNDPTVKTTGPAAPAGMQGTTWSYAQQQQKLWEAGVNSAFGSDLNGFITQAKPRCSIVFVGLMPTPVCAGTPLGTLFDWKGLAHIGYLSDFFQDLIRLDVSFFAGRLRSQTVNVVYGTEAYLRMWERAELLRNAPRWRSNGWTCTEIEELMISPNAGVLEARRPIQPDMGAQTQVTQAPVIPSGISGGTTLAVRGQDGVVQRMVPLAVAAGVVLAHSDEELLAADPARGLAAPNFLAGYTYDSERNELTFDGTTPAVCVDDGDGSCGAGEQAEAQAAADATFSEEIDAESNPEYGNCCFAEDRCRAVMDRCLENDECAACLGDTADGAHCAEVPAAKEVGDCMTARCDLSVEEGGCGDRLLQ